MSDVAMNDLSETPVRTRATDAKTVLAVEDLCTDFRTKAGSVRAVDGVSFELKAGEILAIVGESGSGKSVTSLSIMGLIPEPPGRIAGGRVFFDGQDLTKLTDRQLQKLRGSSLSMIFQEPMTSLNPVLSIGRQMTEGIRQHLGMSADQARRHAVEMMRRVSIPAPEHRLKEYPHQFSGGMLQRIMIAIAMSCNPKVLIADEPTTALDVTIQAQILELMQELRDMTGAAIMLITHDMGVVAETADRVIVMYAGQKIEEGSVEEVFRAPRHPYTLGLLGALPRLGQAGAVGDTELNEIPGVVPPLTDLPPGCRFSDRCSYATDKCRAETPPLETKRPGHIAACWHSDELESPT
ncbi:ABC transporter ATP-binding protein [Tropicimonas isoalkanivorans]|uniref:Peptide/nickel transport system ATP-binding protein n=1 Tax=Tropicimonas isoalkanivorans TaxID=441112 RepID=A0A1I1IC72_9RHOB|nr:ABC transporter ATP-binding protein [Tropicimonas isoalkanivorans]SFC33685.1 peptide/nickel transport system ATP-binding protein [Tropicimonas isoalkanivorans]